MALEEAPPGGGLVADQHRQVVAGHFFHQNLVGHGGGLEFRGGFALDEAGAGCEAVGEAVEAGFGLRFVGAESGGLLRVRLVGEDLGLHGHDG